MIALGAVDDADLPGARRDRLAREVVRLHLRLGGTRGPAPTVSATHRRWPVGGPSPSSTPGS